MQQSEWDRALVSAFYEHPDAYMYRLFVRADDLEGLKRVLDLFASKMTVCRFVCTKLPKLADVLWRRSVKDVDKIVIALSRSNMDSIKNSAGYQRDKRMAKKIWQDGSDNLAASTLAYGACKDHRRLSSRSAWTTCK